MYNDISDRFIGRNQTVILYFYTEFNIPRRYGYPNEIDDSTMTEYDKKCKKLVRNKLPLRISYYKKILTYGDIPIYVIPQYFPIYVIPQYFPISHDAIFNRLSDPELVFFINRYTIKRERDINKINVDQYDTRYRFYTELDDSINFSKTIYKKKYDLIQN